MSPYVVSEQLVSEQLVSEQLVRATTSTGTQNNERVVEREKG